VSFRSEQQEARAKVLMVLNAGTRRTAVDMKDDPLLVGMSGQKISGFLKGLGKHGEAIHYKDNTWGPKKTREVTSTPLSDTPVPTNMRFVINVAARTVMLDVGGLRLPVTVE
jgi:hypothetical protein